MWGSNSSLNEVWMSTIIKFCIGPAFKHMNCFIMKIMIDKIVLAHYSLPSHFSILNSIMWSIKYKLHFLIAVNIGHRNVRNSVVTAVINCVNHLPQILHCSITKSNGAWKVSMWVCRVSGGLITTIICYWTEGAVDMKRHGKTFESLHNNMFFYIYISYTWVLILVKMIEEMQIKCTIMKYPHIGYYVFNIDNWLGLPAYFFTTLTHLT